jgi:hypothetical protein
LKPIGGVRARPLSSAWAAGVTARVAVTMNDATIDALRERELLDWDTDCLRRITDAPTEATCANLEPNALDEKQRFR